MDRVAIVDYRCKLIRRQIRKMRAKIRNQLRPLFIADINTILLDYACENSRMLIPFRRFLLMPDKAYSLNPRDFHNDHVVIFQMKNDQLHGWLITIRDMWNVAHGRKPVANATTEFHSALDKYIAENYEREFPIVEFNGRKCCMSVDAKIEFDPANQQKATIQSWGININ